MIFFFNLSFVVDFQLNGQFTSANGVDFVPMKLADRNVWDTKNCSSITSMTFIANLVAIRYPTNVMTRFEHFFFLLTVNDPIEVAPKGTNDPWLKPTNPNVFVASPASGASGNWLVREEFN